MRNLNLLTLINLFVFFLLFILFEYLWDFDPDLHHVSSCKIFYIRISDKGGGIPDSQMSDIFQYSFTTSTDEEGNINGEQVLDNFSRAVSAKGIGGELSGYGFGLPSAAAYAKFLGGSLTLVSMYGLGTDVFLKLIHIDQAKCFRI